MSEFKPNEPKNLPLKKVAPYGIPFFMALFFLWLAVQEREDFGSEFGFWTVAVILVATAALTLGKVIQMLLDYRNGRNR